VLPYPFDLPFQHHQPLVFLGGDVFTRTRGPAGPAELVTALGVVHPLRRLGPAMTLVRHHLSRSRDEARRLVQAELAARQPGGMDALRYFVEYLVPAFAERDRGEEPPPDALTVREARPADLYAEVDACLDGLPAPDLPAPALWLCGRVWPLRAMPPGEGRLWVRWGEAPLGLTDEYRPVSTLRDEWHQAVRRFVSRAAARVAERCRRGGRLPAPEAAREEVARSGCVQRGDLLFLPGEPPWLGHVIPPHYNRVLGGPSRRDLAITAPLELPPKLYLLAVYRRNPAGRWEPFAPPHGLCLGPGPPAVRPESPGLALAAYLRWAAVRIAANGQFHVSDGPAAASYKLAAA
jgi:hypothetical protein